MKPPFDLTDKAVKVSVFRAGAIQNGVESHWAT